MFQRISRRDTAQYKEVGNGHFGKAREAVKMPPITSGQGTNAYNRDWTGRTTLHTTRLPCLTCHIELDASTRWSLHV